MTQNQLAKETNKNIVICFDVDGTLITYDDKPKYNIINLFHAFKDMGFYIVVWSGGGKDYAEMVCNRLGLEPDHIACKFGTHTFKPTIAVDDEVDAKLADTMIYVVD